MQVNMKDFGIILDHNDKPVNPYPFPFSNNQVGRGRLGKWGPNHAADPVVIWCHGDETFSVLCIYRTDVTELKPALPGGMIEIKADGTPECFTQTLKRELVEEAIDENSEGAQATRILQEHFDNGTILYKGVVADPRNTGNAWIETVAMAVYVDDALVSKLNISRSGSNDGESRGAFWMPVTNANLDI